MTETISLKDKIIELRSKILIHSYMYWYKDNPLVSDALFDAWKKQLVEYQAEHKQKFPNEKIEFFETAFINWDGKDSKGLPLFDEWITNRVEMLDKYKNATPYFNI